MCRPPTPHLPALLNWYIDNVTDKLPWLLVGERGGLDPEVWRCSHAPCPLLSALRDPCNVLYLHPLRSLPNKQHINDRSMIMDGDTALMHQAVRRARRRSLLRACRQPS